MSSSCCWSATTHAGNGDQLRVSAPKLTNKIVILGNHAVGKTSLLNKYSGKNLEGGATFGYFEATLGDRRCQFWDTAGGEKYGPMMPMYLRDTDIVLVAFDLTSENAHQEIITAIGTVMTHSPEAKILLVGTKADLLEGSQVEAVCASLNSSLAKEELKSNVCAVCYATSVVTPSGITELFDHIRDHLPDRSSRCYHQK